MRNEQKIRYKKATNSKKSLQKSLDRPTFSISRFNKKYDGKISFYSGTGNQGSFSLCRLKLRKSIAEKIGKKINQNN
jgi:hypothetical protein